MQNFEAVWKNNTLLLSPHKEETRLATHGAFKVYRKGNSASSVIFLFMQTTALYAREFYTNYS